jgi:hypothetical protein
MTRNPWRQDAAAKQQTIDCLWELSGRTGQPRYGYLSAIFDAARDNAIWPLVPRLVRNEEETSPYQGRSAQELARVAAYLVSPGTDGRVFDWLWNDGWGRSWGTFFWSLVSMDSLRNHFRRLTCAQVPEGGRLLFRFYDPRVLRVFAPRCEPARINELFGPVARFMMEDEDGGGIITVRPQTGPGV